MRSRCFQGRRERLETLLIGPEESRGAKGGQRGGVVGGEGRQRAVLASFAVEPRVRAGEQRLWCGGCQERGRVRD